MKTSPPPALARLVAIAITLAALTACTPTAPQTAGEAAGLTPIPTPNAEQEPAITAALIAIDARMDHHRYIDRLRSTCGDVRDGMADTDLAARAQGRIQGGTFPDPTIEQSQAFVDLARLSICPDW